MITNQLADSLSRGGGIGLAKVFERQLTHPAAHRRCRDAAVTFDRAKNFPYMKELLSNLIEALREELKQYGEMLALLDQQQQLVMRRQVAELPENVNCVNAQAGVIAAARQEREQRQRHLARLLALPETSGFAVLIPLLPADYRPLVDALVHENNELLVRVQKRARQNHLLLEPLRRADAAVDQFDFSRREPHDLRRQRPCSRGGDGPRAALSGGRMKFILCSDYLAH